MGIEICISTISLLSPPQQTGRRGLEILLPQSPAVKEILLIFYRRRSTILRTSEQTLPSLFHEPATRLAASTESIEAHQRSILLIKILLSALTAHDPDTAAHSRRVAALCEGLGQISGLPPQQQDKVTLAGLLHDFGKIAFSREILNCPTPLKGRDLRKLKSGHLLIGYYFIQVLWPEIAEIIAYNHLFDGTLPMGHSFHARSVETEILSAADLYDALACKRPYQARQHSPAEIEAVLRDRRRGYSPKTIQFLCRQDHQKLREIF